MAPARPLGVYVHVPFCRIHCPYCDFYTYPAARGRDADFVEALLREIALAPRRLDTGSHQVRSIYFGGGTPSLLRNEQLSTILDALRRTLPHAGSVEVTLEANPEDLTARRVRSLEAAGVDRISLGVQSLRDAVLTRLGRVHSSAQVRTALECLAGHRNWNADLIFGWEGQSVEDLHGELEELLAYEPDHVSLYQLTLEPRTRFGVLAAQGLVNVAPADGQAELYLAAVEQLEAHGLQQYEVSNFARAGARSRHNVACWKRQAYLGLGPSACSQLWSRRTENVRSLPEYVRLLARGYIPVTFVELLSPRIERTEAVWLGLRTREGVPRDTLANYSQSVLDGLVAEELANYRSDGSYALSPKGMALADEIVLRVLQTDTPTKVSPRHLKY